MSICHLKTSDISLLNGPSLILWLLLSLAELIRSSFKNLITLDPALKKMLQLLRRSYSSQPKLLDVVSKLRDQTSISMNLCRKAAIESNLDFNLALEILSKSANVAFKPSLAGVSNFGKEGLIGIMGSAERKCLIEVQKSNY
jgi:hypothetical protein